MDTAGKGGRGVDGVIPVIPVPFTASEEIDEAALRRLIDFAVRCEVSAVCLPAYGSEFYKLSEPERLRVVRVAVEQSAGRLLVIAQSNHGASRMARELAETNAAAGADLISITIPRLFALSDDDLLRFLVPILNAVKLPCLLQDFNPGGPTVGVEFVRRLRKECPNLRYLKLEEPMLSTKVRDMLQATGGELGVLEGWGGLYMMELIPAGICGIMPGLSMADVLQRIFDRRRDGNSEEAFRLFEKVAPQIVFSLQNLELYLYCEKRLLEARGLLSNSYRRKPSHTPDPLTEIYVDELNGRILRALEQAGFRTVAAEA